MGLLNTKVNKLTYNEFLTELENSKVTELTITQNSSQGLYELSGKLEGYNVLITSNIAYPVLTDSNV